MPSPWSEPAAPELTRRQLLAGAAGVSAGLALRPSVAGAVPCAKLTDVEHVVLVMQENRSFDQYFGTYRGARGFGDPRGVFAQPGYAASSDGHLMPFRFDTENNKGECVNDVTHDWGPQHRVRNGGAMDAWVTTHLAVDGPGGTTTMGYYQRADLPFYYALADAFTICDGYFCSAMGPTDPNRLYWMTATIDPAGTGGGPVVQSAGTPTSPPTLSWTTMPERLQANGISWKVYASPDSTYQDGDHTLLFFKQYQSDPTLAAGAFGSTYPASFMADAAAGTLPQVSWVILPVAQLEHPSAPPALGEYGISQLLGAVMGNQSLWAKTVVFITWDENGGFFDHVPPPVAPAGTPGEYLTTATLPSEAQGIRGPIGLGFRVPTLVVSPFSRGGLVCSDPFDHTSMLRFIETRFGVEVPHLSAWRRGAVGDLTSSLNLAAPDASVPALPSPSPLDPRVVRECVPGALTAAPYPVPPNRMPVQEAGTATRPSGCGVAASTTGATPASGSSSRLPATGRTAGTAGLALLAAATGLAALRNRRHA